MLSRPLIQTHDLRKTFGRGPAHAVEAVHDVNLAIDAGGVFGLLGPNGAGKTTLMRMLCTLLLPTSGRAEVCGFDLVRRQREIRRRIGYVGQKGGMEQVATGRENLMLQARLYQMSRADAARRVDELIERLHLAAFADRKTETYSGGQRRLCDLAAGVVHLPAVLFLDEPTTGLDPQSRARVWDEVRDVHEHGTTIVLTTHYLEEADALCDRVAIIDAGRVVAEGSPAELKKQVDGDTIAFGYATPDLAEAASRIIASDADILQRQVNGNVLSVRVDSGDEALPAMMRLLGREHVAPGTVHMTKPTLDDVFLKMTGRTLTESDAGS